MDNRTIVSTLFKSPEHHPKAVGEAFPVFIPRGVREVILDFLEFDVKPIKSVKKEKSISEEYSEFTLFGRNLQYFLNTDALGSAAHSVLNGNEEDIQTVLKLVKENPMLLHIPTSCVDPCHRTVKGSLLQMALMLGDVNLKKNISDEKQMGLVERFKLAANLSDEIISSELKVVTGKEAIAATHQRNQLILDAVDKLIKELLEIKIHPNEKFSHFKMKCIPFSIGFDDELEFISRSPITSGFIFDPSVIYQAAKKLEKNMKSLGGWFSFKCGIFKIIALGTLQKYLSIRDAQIVDKGILNYIEKHQVPLRNLYQTLYYSSSVGDDCYLNGKGNQETEEKCGLVASTNIFEFQSYEKLMLNKMSNMKKFIVSQSFRTSIANMKLR